MKAQISLLLLSGLFLLTTGSPLQNFTDPLCIGDCKDGVDEPLMNKVMQMKEREWKECAEEHHCPTVLPSIKNNPVKCVDGKAGEYDCSNVDLLSFVSLDDLGCSGDGNDIWGWTDPQTGNEYALVGCSDGTSFVDVTDPLNPKVIDFLKTHSFSSPWRDIKVYKDYAYIVSEAREHGMQVVDLKQMRNGGPIVETSHFEYETLTGNTHNIVSNEETGYMYAVGTDRWRGCHGGLYMIDVRDPSNPKYAGCFAGDEYVHDAQCVVYKGPDTRYQGREICFCYNEDTLTIVDVHDKTKPVMLSRISYVGKQYTHQGWLNEEQTHLLLNDELDEVERTAGGELGSNTRTLVWNVVNLEKPERTGQFISSETAVDHNLYIRGNLAYESNYCAGLRILDVTNMAEDHQEHKLEEVGYFDVAPDCSTTEFLGSWSSYVYFNSETIIVSSIERGLFVLKYTGEVPSE